MVPDRDEELTVYSRSAPNVRYLARAGILFSLPTLAFPSRGAQSLRSCVCEARLAVFAAWPTLARTSASLGTPLLEPLELTPCCHHRC